MLIQWSGRRIRRDFKPDFPARAKPGIELLFWPGGSTDLAGHNAITYGASGEQIVTAKGRAWRVAATSGAEAYVDTAVSGGVPVTYLAVVKFNSLAGTTFSGVSGNDSGAVIASQREADADRSATFCISNVSTSGNTTMGLWFGLDSAGNARGRKGGTALTTGVWYTLAGTFDPAGGFPGGFHVYVNGRLDDAATANIGTATTFSGTRTRFGAHHLWPSTSNDDADIEIAYIARLPRSLTAAEIAKWHSDPFGFVVEPASRHAFVMLGSGGGSSSRTITPAGGVNFTGAVDFIRTRVQAPSGAILFGGAAALARTKVFDPTGGVTLSGDATPSRGRAVGPSGGVLFSGGSAIAPAQATAKAAHDAGKN